MTPQRSEWAVTGASDSVRDLAERLAALVTPEDVRHGWNLADATLNIGGAETDWSVTLIGPISTDVTRHYFLGGDHDGTLGPPIFRVQTGAHGVMRASTPDELIGACREWLETVR
jgi:hypothetical protein